MKLETKQYIKDAVRAGATKPEPAADPTRDPSRAPIVVVEGPMPPDFNPNLMEKRQALREQAAAAVLSDEIVIDITGNARTHSMTLRPAEVSRLRGRYGRGPDFEKWVLDRIRDAMISFGGG